MAACFETGYRDGMHSFLKWAVFISARHNLQELQKDKGMKGHGETQNPFLFFEILKNLISIDVEVCRLKDCFQIFRRNTFGRR